MKPALEDLNRCFQGVIPCSIATCSKSGVPNITLVSQVKLIDARRVALSCQFFNKTRQNVEENPRACLQIYDPLTFDAYRLLCRFDHSEKEGPLFDEMSLRIDAIASHTGMSGIFRLLSADVYEVLELERIEGFLRPPEPCDEPELAEKPPGPITELRGLQSVSSSINLARDLGELLESALDALDRLFHFSHSMVLLPDETGRRLFTIASHGFGESGIGAEVSVGEGLIGTVAEQRRLISMSATDELLRYGRAVRDRVSATDGSAALTPEIPLPGLSDARSHMALPLLLQDKLVGVLAVESRDPLCFQRWHEAFLAVIGNQIAIGIDHMQSRDDEELEPPSQLAPAPGPAAQRTRVFRFYKNDDCVFVDGEYLIRNVPGKILWKILKEHQAGRETEFSNRELRLDTTLGLPPIKDNLESRLILLRKRLEQKCPDVRIVPTRRGRFMLEATSAVVLEERECG